MFKFSLLAMLVVDGRVTTKIITQDNFKDALFDKDIPTFYKQEIKDLFEE
jgi:hypothetical protein